MLVGTVLDLPHVHVCIVSIDQLLCVHSSAECVVMKNY